MNFFVKLLGSGLFSGYLPFAPGTFGSFVALFVYLIPGFSDTIVIIPSIIVSFIVGVKIGKVFEESFGKDPGKFTLDEFVGTWISYLATPQSFIWIILTFVIWRVLDIIKPFPANRMEKFNGGFGIMMDDVVSGMYSLIIIYIFKFIFY